MRLTPINSGEAIFEPFWDMELNELSQWEITPGAAHGLEVEIGWSVTRFAWVRRPGEGTAALDMVRDYRKAAGHGPDGVDCSQYDALMISIMPPEHSRLELTAETDVGTITERFAAAGPKKTEPLVALRGASRLRRLRVRLYAGSEGAASGWFNWIGLQNTGRLQHHLAQWKRFDSRWDGYLKPESYVPSFKPRTGLVVTDAELETLRRYYHSETATHGASPMAAAAAAAIDGPDPETMISEFVNFWGDTRYCRERDFPHLLLQKGLAAAVTAVVTQDAALQRVAARYAMSIAMCANWDDGFVCRFPEGTFEHRSFVQSLCAWETAAIFDLAGEWIEDPGRDLIFRRIAEEGVAHIAFSTWKHEYIWSCNQLAWFSPGRILGLATLGTTWPRTNWYLDRAKDELVESLDLTILPDGGYVEGPTYFRCVGRDAGLSLFYYARARGVAFTQVIPDSMKRTADFAEVLYSTDEAQDFIPICDGRPLHDQESLAIMAAALPNSQWTRLFRRSMDRAHGSPFTVVYQVIDIIPDQAPPLRPLVFLPEMGVMASTRSLGNDLVKLFLMGNKAGAGHSHEDKGSFVLEYAGETFAMDPGTCDYSSPFSLLVKDCQRHNMLLPYGTAERPHPQSPLPVDVKPKGHGDAQSFTATIDATPGWEGYYKNWIRQFDSPDPSHLIITDRYELAGGTGVEFLWNTRLPVTTTTDTVTIQGREHRMRLAIPAGVRVTVECLPLEGTDYQYQIRFLYPQTAGTLRVEVRFE